MKMNEIEQKMIERLLRRVREVAETAILTRDGGEDDSRQALDSHTLTQMDREIMTWVNNQLDIV